MLWFCSFVISLVVFSQLLHFSLISFTNVGFMLHAVVSVFLLLKCLQYFDTVGLVARRATGHFKNLNDGLPVWLSVWSEVHMICILLADATATPSSLASRMTLPFWYRLAQVVLEKKPLSGCNSLFVSTNHTVDSVLLRVHTVLENP